MPPSPNCPLCDAPGRSRFELVPSVIYRCAACDFEWVYPTPADEALNQVYEGEYFAGAGLGYGDYFIKEAASNQRKAEARAALLCRLTPERGRLLDFGAASGVFVSSAREKGWDAIGVEPSLAARVRAAENIHPMLLSSFAEAAKQGPFNVVTCWDVLEHLSNPLQTLKEFSLQLNQGGLLAAVVPVIENLNARFFPRTWDQYKPPEHLNFFSRKSLRIALESIVGPVVHVESAWQRYGRVLGIGERSNSGATLALGYLEARFASVLAKMRILPGRWFEDSVLMVARKPVAGGN